MSNSGEIDLRLLLLQSLKFIERNLKVIVILISMGILFGFFRFKFAKPVYQSNMILETGILDIPTSSNLILVLNDLVEGGGHEELSIKLGLSIEELSKVIKIEATDILENEVENARIFKVEVEVLNNDILNVLQTAILEYLEKNPYVKKRVALETEAINKQIEYLNKEMEKLNSLKGKVSKGYIFDNDNRGDVVLFDPVNIYREGIALFNREIELRQKLQIIDNFQIIQGFTPFNKPVRPKLSFNLFEGFSIGFFLSFLVILFKEIRKFSRTVQESE